MCVHGTCTNVCVHVHPCMYHSYNQQEHLAVFEMVDFTE